VGDDESDYTSGDGLIKVLASHNYGKRTRRLLRIDTSLRAKDSIPESYLRVTIGHKGREAGR